MTWLISQALMRAYENLRYSQEPVEEYSADTCSGGEPSALSSGNPIPQAYCAPDKMTAFSRLSRSGMTFAPLTDGRGEVLLTWFLADFRARTSASPEAGKASTVSAAGSGEKWPASLAKYDPDSHSLKTAQGSLFSDSIESSVTLPRSGSMRSGECFQQPILMPPMIVNGCGSSRETFPTPTVCGNYNKKGASAKSGDGLATYVRKYPTPTATAYKGWSPNHNRANTDDRIDYTIEREAHESGTPGRLNPMWEEWLMAWPIGWTQLKPLETDKFLEWQLQHSISFASAQDGDA